MCSEVCRLFSGLLMTLYSDSTVMLRSVEWVSSVRGCLLGSYSDFTELLIEERVYEFLRLYVGKFYDK